MALVAVFAVLVLDDLAVSFDKSANHLDVLAVDLSAVELLVAQVLVHDAFGFVDH